MISINFKWMSQFTWQINQFSTEKKHKQLNDALNFKIQRNEKKKTKQNKFNRLIWIYMNKYVNYPRDHHTPECQVQRKHTWTLEVYLPAHLFQRTMMCSFFSTWNNSRSANRLRECKCCLQKIYIIRTLNSRHSHQPMMTEEDEEMAKWRATPK